MSSGIGGTDTGFHVEPELERARERIKEHRKSIKKAAPVRTEEFDFPDPDPWEAPTIEGPPPKPLPVAPPIIEENPTYMARRKAKPAKKASTRKPRRDQLNVPIPSELDQRIRNAAHALRLTKTALTIEAVERELSRLERKHNEGEPFPNGQLQPGRPLGK